MKTSLFDFTLPDELIAATPASPRDSARMLAVGDELLDRNVSDLPAYLRPGDIMVFNDTRVIPARLHGFRRAAKVEVLLHKPMEGYSGEMDFLWRAFARPAKRLNAGDRIEFAEGFFADIMEKLASGEVLLRFSCGGADLRDQLARHGHMPLPPYIERKHKADASDQSNYQTVYAKHDGSVAAPTAGLHFTDALLAAIDAAGVKRVHVTLHVGAGTFLPVKVEDTDQHVMHSEYAVVTQEVADAVNDAKSKGGRVIAVGTTSLRTLESATDEQGVLQPFSRETAIFITPGYRFRLVDLLMTNFHLPCSTLFMLVSAFSGLERMQAVYSHAIAQRYRFYSYGDSCLLSPK